MADVDVAALQADRRHLEQRSADLVAEVERLKREFKRVEEAEERAAEAEAEAEAANARADSLNGDLSRCQQHNEVLHDRVHELQADAEALAAIKGALGL